MRATFAAIPQRRLTVTKGGASAGTVTSSPVGLNCGATCVAAFNGIFEGKPAILGHVYGEQPVPTSFTLPFVITRSAGERSERCSPPSCRPATTTSSPGSS